MSKVISRMFWFCIATLCDWLKNLAPLSQLIRKKIQNQTRLSCARRGLHAFVLTSDWVIGLSVSVVIGQSNYFCLKKIVEP